MRNHSFNIFVWLLAILLGLSGCVAEVEETLFPYGKVKTEFSLMIPGDVEKSGRMTGKDVQISGASGDFLGMKDIYLFPFVTDSRQVQTGQAFTNFSVLGNSGNIIQNSKEGKSIWYSDVEVPANTNTFLMYGVAKEPQGGIVNQYFHYGNTKTAYDQVDVKHAKVEVLKFSPVTIQTQSSFVGGACPAFDWARGKLKYVLDATVAGSTSPTPQQVWYLTDYKALADLYEGLSMASMGGGVVGASSKTLLAIYEDLYNNLSKVKAEAEKAAQQKTGTGAEAEQAAVALAQAIMDRITQEYAAGNMGYQIQAVKTGTQTDGDLSYPIYQLSYVVSDGKADPNFPLAQFLPDGAFTLKIVAEPGRPATVGYNIEDVPTNAQKSTAWDLYAYPAQLFYFANTALGASAKSMKESYQLSAPWNEFANTKNFPSTSVSPLTKSVVLIDPVEYAVGNLVTTLQLGSSKLLDFNNQPVDFSQGMLWTGIVVADQKEVGWNFTREISGLNDRSYMVYDRELNGLDPQKGGVVVKTAEAMSPALPVNYTLVYPTKVVTAPYSSENTDKAHLLLEFENGDKDFRGAADCLIPAHTRFYIPAVLDLQELNPANQGQIFKAGYKTKVDLVVKNLKNAMNTVPDLRTVKTKMGVSIKVKWEPGFNFKVDVNAK